MFESLDKWLTVLVLRIVPHWCTPNHITWLGILVIPLVPTLYFFVSPWAGVASFVLGSVTDFVDGRLARERGRVTRFGRHLDIVRDLGLVWSTVALLWWVDIVQIRGEYLFLFCLLIIMLIREIIVFATKKFYRVSHSEEKVLRLGKLKTFVFMLGLSFLLTSKVMTNGLMIGATLVGIATFLSLLSGRRYVQLFKLRRRS